MTERTQDERAGTAAARTHVEGELRVRRVRTDRLVSLLHERAELRSAYAPAELLDQAVRWGA